MEGAGVHLKRVFGFSETPLFDPFLLLDHFGSSNPQDYMAGFPWHPHRGIETVTYMLSGSVEHGDSLGNQGVINSGDIQWMTAGNGIIHQEMPQRNDGPLSGFQLWVNLPAAQKMMNPRYRDIQSHQVPVVQVNENVQVKIVSGEINGIKGPVQDLIVDVEYLDVTMAANGSFEHSVKTGYKVFAYIYQGRGYFDTHTSKPIETEHVLILEQGDLVAVRTEKDPLRFLLISGKPLDEPIAWYGPIVMNTDEELELAFREYRDGTFIKHSGR
jgi:quercetin 2,3-dioxygenase